MATEVAIEDLDSWLGNQPDNTVDTAYEITITNLTSSNYDNIKTALNNNYTKFVDLRTTQLPDGITNLLEKFRSCYSLVYAPQIPASVIYMQWTFRDCIVLKEAPKLPEGVYELIGTFYGCRNMTNAPIVPYTAWMEVSDAFYNCPLSHKPIMGARITGNPFGGVTTKNWKGTRSQVETFNPACSDDCEIQIYNDDRVTLEDTFHNVDISTLSTYLAGLDPNTVSTAYKVYIRGLSTLNYNDIKNALTSNDTKYVDLSTTSIPDGVTSMEETFLECASLVKSPVIPDSVTNMQYTFSNCSLVTAPVIPNGVTNMIGTFADCTSLVTAPVIPDGVTNMNSCFYSCSLTIAPVIPDSVTNMQYTFARCTSLVNVPVIPDSVTNMQYTFGDCTSLRKIEEFNIPLATLKNNPDFRDMFAGCTSLEAIGHKVEYSDDWHLVYLDFDTNTVEGKIYSRDKTSVSITQTTITKNTLSLPLITDELMFSSLISTADLEDIIEGTAQQQGMLDTNYSWFGKIVVPPTGDNFIMYAKNPSKFKSNIDFGGGGAELEIVSTSKSFTPAKDKRIIVDTSGVTVTLNYGGTNGVVAEVFAMESCTLTYYTSSSATSSLSMSACSKAVFVYYNGGWALNSNYGTTNSVTVDNMQSVSSNAVARAINPSSTTIIESTNKRTVSVTAGKTDWWGMVSYPAPNVPQGKRLIRTFPRCSNIDVAVCLGTYTTIDNPAIITVADVTSSVQIWLCIEVADL